MKKGEPLKLISLFQILEAVEDVNLKGESLKGVDWYVRWDRFVQLWDLRFCLSGGGWQGRGQWKGKKETNAKEDEKFNATEDEKLNAKEEEKLPVRWSWLGEEEEEEKFRWNLTVPTASELFSFEAEGPRRRKKEEGGGRRGGEGGSTSPQQMCWEREE